MTQGRTKSRVEFVRLTSPDERSLLAFKCWLRETCQLIHTSLRTYTPPSKGESRTLATDATYPTSACDRSIIRYIRVKTEHERQLYVFRSRAYLEENMPDALGAPGGDTLVETIAGLTNANETLWQMLQTAVSADRPKRQKDTEIDGDWHPSRRNVAETVMGTFISHSSDPSGLVATAHHLSEGLPERDGKREHGVRSDHVNDALYRFACDNFRFISSVQIIGTLARVGREELIADQLWEKVRAACKPSPVSYDRVHQLFDAGKLMDWAADLEETVGLPSHQQIVAAYGVVSEMAIRRLSVEQKKLAGEANPKDARKTDLVSRAAAADASGPS